MNDDAPQTEHVTRWTRQIPRDVVLVILGAAIAFASEQLRDSRRQHAQAATALLSIRDELRANATLVTAARDHHSFLADTLAKLADHHHLPSVELYSNGMFNPANVSNTAWQAARETGALGEIPLATVLSIAPAYEAQDRYRTLGEAMNTAIMTDVRRDGISTVLRDRFAQFVPLDLDFSHREGGLLDKYRKALAQLDSVR